MQQILAIGGNQGFHHGGRLGVPGIGHESGRDVLERHPPCDERDEEGEQHICGDPPDWCPACHRVEGGSSLRPSDTDATLIEIIPSSRARIT